MKENKNAEIIEAFYSMSRYLDDLLNIDNNLFWRYGQTNLLIRTSIK